MAKAKWDQSLNRYNPIEWAVRILDGILRPNSSSVGASKRANPHLYSTDFEALNIQIRQDRERANRADKAELVRGAPFVAWKDRIENLKRLGDLHEAEALLLECIRAAEKSAAIRYGSPTGPPWHYYQLAIIYRRQGRRDHELELLRRYAQKVGGNSVPARGRQLIERLNRLESRGSTSDKAR